jgi:hypothetical protein
MSETRPRAFRVVVLVAIAAVIWVVVFTAAAALMAGLTSSLAAPSTVAFLAVAVVGGWIERSPGFGAAVARAPRASRIAFTIGAIAAAVQLGWLVPFIIDPTRDTWTAHPWRPMQSRHSCVSSYWMAGVEVRNIPSIYDESLYSEPQADPKATRRAKLLGPFNIDQYEYPPPFLLLPRATTLVAPDFWSFRRLWFALNLAIVVIAAVAVARRVDSALGTHAIWLVPFVIAAPPAMVTFMAGNIQLAIIALSMLAMRLFERDRPVAGGLLLAFATVSKLFPGVLLIYLLLRRQWKPVAWAAAWAVVLTAVSLIDLGWQPYATFVDHLPRLLSGEAFPAFRNPVSISVNSSVPGIPFKLGLFGVPHMDFTASKIVGWVYSLVALAAVYTLARRPTRPGYEPLVWLVVIVFATMRSPFMASYSGFPSLWLATLVVAASGSDRRTRTLGIVAWCILAVGFGPAGAPLQVNAIWTFVHTVTAFVLAGTTARLVRDSAPAPEPEPRLDIATA